MTRLVVVALLATSTFFTLSPVQAETFKQSYDFALDKWFEIESTDGAVTIHRVRLNPREARITRSALQRPFNSEFLSTVQLQLDYTNGADRQWQARIEVRWLDADGEVIDGFSGNEDLNKRSARKLAEMSVATLKYGLKAAKTLEITVKFEP